LDGKTCIEHADDVAVLAEDFVLVGALAEHLHGHVRVGTEHLEDVFYRKNLIGMAHTTLFIMLINQSFNIALSIRRVEISASTLGSPFKFERESKPARRMS